MNDLQEILAAHRSKRRKGIHPRNSKKNITPTYAEIPDIFFDDILVKFKLNRAEIIVLMYLYRRVWCRPNINKVYGISDVLSHIEMSKQTNIPMQEIHLSIQKLESLGFIETIRSGQYFVRRYFTLENDNLFGQVYDNF